MMCLWNLLNHKHYLPSCVDNVWEIIVYFVCLLCSSKCPCGALHFCRISASIAVRQVQKFQAISKRGLSPRNNRKVQNLNFIWMESIAKFRMHLSTGKFLSLDISSSNLHSFVIVIVASINADKWDEYISYQSCIHYVTGIVSFYISD